MHYLHPLELPALDLGGAERGDTASEFCAVQIANPHHFPGGKVSVAPRHAGWQQALASFAQRLPRTASGRREPRNEARWGGRKKPPPFWGPRPRPASATNTLPPPPPATTR